ncbi:hypothetical protein HOY80DRAFT_997872 [Tuber brumale]|nr:hypothetical protein HOY80DRAFT_997872 [Tuber brumale]
MFGTGTMETNIPARTAQPPFKQSNPGFLNACQRKLESFGKLFHNIRRSPSNSEPEPNPEDGAYPDLHGTISSSQPISRPASRFLLLTKFSHLLPSTGSKRSLLEDGKNTSRPNVVLRKRVKSKEKNKTDKGDGVRDRSAPERDAISKEKRHSTGKRHPARMENRNESHNTLKSGPSSTKSIGANEGYNILGSSAVLRGGLITDETCKADKREKASKRSSINNSNSVGETAPPTMSLGHNGEKRRRTRNAKNGNERLDTFDNDHFTANERNKTDEMETTSKRRKSRKSSNINESNSPPESTVSIVTARQTGGEAGNSNERRNTFDNASPTAKRRSRKDKVDETNSKDKTNRRRKISKRDKSGRDSTPDITAQWAREVANRNEIYKSSNALRVASREGDMDKGYESTGSNVAVAGGYSKIEKTLELETAASTRRPKRDTSKRRKSKKNSDTHERRKRTKNSITIMTGEGATGSTIRIRSTDGAQVLLLTPNGSIEISSGRRPAHGGARSASG